MNSRAQKLGGRRRWSWLICETANRLRGELVVAFESRIRSRREAFELYVEEHSIHAETREQAG